MLLALLVPALPARTALAAAEERDCVAQLIRGSAPQIACELPLRMTEKELVDLRKASRELLQDADCRLSVNIARALITAAVENADHVFEAPPQPVTCDIRTKESLVPISFTFAPRVEIKGGVAVKANPGMSPVTGVSRLLSFPVVVFVNSSRHVETGMLETVNAYLTHVKRTAAAKQ